MIETSFLRHKYLNGWGLFWLVALTISVLVLVPFFGIDSTKPVEISGMIQQSVRLAVPWLFVAFGASAFVKVFPNNFSKWIMRNRRIFGLLFAAGMAWQLFFIGWLVFGFFDYYMEEAYSYYDLSEQIPGYLILIAMTVTSFKPGRKMISANAWRILHAWGIYFLWVVLWSTYWFELYYYDDIQAIDYIYYWMGMAAWCLRITAWTVDRQIKIKRKDASFRLSPIAKVISIALVFLAVFLISLGEVWTPISLGLLATISFGPWLELVLPFIVIVPLIGAAIIATPSQKLSLTKQ